jgi:hypothetical protein
MPLVVADMDERPELTPWMANVLGASKAHRKEYVMPLIQAVEAAFRSAGYRYCGRTPTTRNASTLGQGSAQWRSSTDAGRRRPRSCGATSNSMCDRGKPTDGLAGTIGPCCGN